jgi:hypothetical protein
LGYEPAGRRVTWSNPLGAFAPHGQDEPVREGEIRSDNAVGRTWALSSFSSENHDGPDSLVHGITSLGRDRAKATRLLALARSQWGIENGLHSVRAVTLGEDACRVRTGSAPQVLAALRNAVVHLLDGVQAASKAAAPRSFAARPFAALPRLFT